jgi:hypothetical protein
MATQTQKSLGDQLVASARKFGNQYVSFVEQSTDRALDIERKLAGQTKQEWLAKLVEQQADFVKDASAAYTQALRDLLK